MEIPSIAYLHVVITVLHFLNDHVPYTVYKIFFILLAYKGAPRVTAEFNQRM